MPKTIRTDHILGPAEVRAAAGNVSRSTMERWRRDHDFPKPFLTLEAVELWDKAAVRAWLRENKQWRRKRRRPR